MIKKNFLATEKTFNYFRFLWFRQTTLMNLMSGLLKPSSGSISFEGFIFSNDENIIKLGPST